MRYLFLPLLVVLVIGFGCVGRHAVIPAPPAPQTTEAVRGMVGVLQSWDETNGTAQIRLVDSSEESVLLPDDYAMGADQIGDLLVVDGTRDLSTRLIAALHVERVSSPDLRLVSPSPGATVTSPVLVTGFGRVFEQTFAWRIKDASGTTVAHGYANTDASDAGVFGPFQFEIFLPALGEKDFTLDLFEVSPADGSETNLVSTPLKLLSIATSTFNVYFSNAFKDKSGVCETVFPVQRKVAQTSAVARAALLQLLAGPTPDEQIDGYRTNIPDGVGLNSLVIGQGTATADFTSELNHTAGSCRVAAIRSQIENTLNQFSSLETITISVDGDADTALQP